MHHYSQDFYGQPLRLVALGYIRCVGHRLHARAYLWKVQLCVPVGKGYVQRRLLCAALLHTLARCICPSLSPHCRPEVRFSGLQELLGRINTDIGIARSQLDLPHWQAYVQQLAAAPPPRP